MNTAGLQFLANIKSFLPKPYDSLNYTAFIYSLSESHSGIANFDALWIHNDRVSPYPSLKAHAAIYDAIPTAFLAANGLFRAMISAQTLNR